MGPSVEDLTERFEEGGAGGGCPFHAMSKMSMTGSSPVTTANNDSGGGINANIDSGGTHSNANVHSSSPSNNNSTNNKLTTSLTIMKAISKMKHASRQQQQPPSTTTTVDAKEQQLLRFEAAKDARRLNAYLSGMGLKEIDERLYSGGSGVVKNDDNDEDGGGDSNRCNDRRGSTSRMLSMMAEKSTRRLMLDNEGKEEDHNGMNDKESQQDNLNKPGSRQKNETAEERYGPFPKSTPVPANDSNSNKAASATTQQPADDVKSQHQDPWNPQSHPNQQPDSRDINTPDAWIARHGTMIRLSGQHPYNAAPPMSSLMECGFLTPGHLHFTRNHGAVPRLRWEEHVVEVMVHSAATAAWVGDNSKKNGDNGSSGRALDPLLLTMNDLATDPTVHSLPVSMACIGNRRSEFNALRRTIGFSWGIATVATSVFRGVPLRTVLLRAGVSPNEEDWAGCHVEFVGADKLPNKVGEGPFEEEKWGKKVRYGTSVPLGKAMDPSRDMMLAFEANGEPLPPDHGYPCRIIVPGSTAARSVKWVSKINVLPHQSCNLYHHHDNKIFPPHVLDLEASMDKEKQWWYQSEYIVHEEKKYPAGGSSVLESSSTANNDMEDQLIQFSGYAYSGGGRRITRVELSLDAGTNWDIAELIVTESPTPHDMHWCWVFWRANVPARLLLNSKEVWCRAWDESNNTQPVFPTWNLMGLGQNSVYRVKIHVSEDGVVEFEHPTQPGGQPGGWMKEPNSLPKSAGFGRHWGLVCDVHP